jgi:hypothetical protein
MTTAVEHEVQQELVFLNNADFLKDEKAVLGWTCIREKVIDCATGRIQLDFRRVKE